jgi:hypothetical protein
VKAIRDSRIDTSRRAGDAARLTGVTGLGLVAGDGAAQVLIWVTA